MENEEHEREGQKHFIKKVMNNFCKYLNKNSINNFKQQLIELNFF